MEDRGEARGGRFVSGFLGEQFALPIAVDSLRATRSKEATGEIVKLSAADPLNLVGIIVPGDKVASLSGNEVAFKDGCAVDPSTLPTAPQSQAGKPFPHRRITLSNAYE